MIVLTNQRGVTVVKEVMGFASVGLVRPREFGVAVPQLGGR